MRLAATLPSNTLICQIALKKFETGCFTNNLLKAIHVHWTEIDNIKISDTAFEINTEECVFYIPSGTHNAYRHHLVFDKFKNIEIEKNAD